MNSSVHLISSSAMVSEAAQRMKQYDIGILPVLEHNRVVGILTDRDVVVRSVVAGKNPKMPPVKNIIGSGDAFCS